MTMVITNLEKRGYVSRRRDQSDRRHFTVSLTDEGRRLIDELFPKHAQRIVELMSILEEDEQDQLGMLCKTLGRQAREA